MITTREPVASLVIPTHNRHALLRRALGALEKQDFRLEDLEVVVVADGCRDPTLSMLAAYTPPFRLKIVELPGLGPAEARNAGAEAATASRLIFLDDDIEPMPGFVQAHVEAGRQAPESVALGPYPPFPTVDSSFFRLAARHWWHEHFRRLGRLGHRHAFSDLLTGNLSISAQLWREMGGLDPQFRAAHEDHEFGIRLIKADIPFLFVPEALGFHHEHETLTLAGAFRRAFEEGRADTLIGEKHPEIRSELRLVRPARRLLHGPVFRLGGRLDRLARLMSGLLPVFQRLRLRASYRRLHHLLQHYWYMRGVAEHLRSFGEWRTYVDEARVGPAEPSVTLDLREGLCAAEATLDHVRPREIILRYGEHALGRLPISRGAERWRGAHLRSAIRDHFGAAYLRAAVLDGLIQDLDKDDRKQLVQKLGELGPFRLRTFREPWIEPLQQWRRVLKK